MTEKIIRDKISSENEENEDEQCIYYIVNGTVVVHPNIIKDGEIIVLSELREG